MQTKSILIAGASGFIGRHLVKHLESQGHRIYRLGRGNDKKERDSSSFTWSELESGNLDIIAPDVIINLAGANVGAGRWTAMRKKELKESRVKSTQALSNYVARIQKKPELFIQASAIGYYGYRVEMADEDSPKGEGFLADLTEKWESSLFLPDEVRRVVMRLGIVVGDGGAVKKMSITAPFGFVALPGGGKQYLSVIKVEDVVAFVKACIENAHCQGIVNLVDSKPIRLKELMKPIAPLQILLPGWIFKLVLGQMAVETILADQKAISNKK